MSLKAFHIIFVIASTILALGFGGWAVQQYRSHGEASSLAVAILSFACGVGLIGYGWWFLRKLKGVSYL